MKSRKWTAVLVSCLWTIMLLIPAVSFAADDEAISSDLLYRELEDGSVMITGLLDPEFSGILVIPDTVDGLPVTGVDSNAFSGYNITSLMILEGVELIGDGAFADCQQLKDVRLPESASATAEESGVGEGVFQNCSSLTDVFLPASWTAIPAWTFAGCPSLPEITVSADLTVFGDHAFDGCTNFGFITYGEDRDTKISRVGDAAFRGTALQLVIMEVNSDEEKSIGAYAFADCRQLTILEVNATSFGDHLAADSALEHVVLLDMVTEVPEAAFSGCGSLQMVLMDPSVRQIGQDAFEGCDALKNICYFGTPDQYAEIEVASGNEALQSAEVWYLPILTVAEDADGTLFLEGLTAESAAQISGPLTASLDMLPGSTYGTGDFRNQDGDVLAFDDPVTTGTIAFWQDYSLQEVTSAVVVRGDVTGSGVISIAQLVRMAQALNGSITLDPAQQRAGDLDGNGSMNITDLVLEANRLTGAQG